jgi:hypothetical protein
MPRRMVRGRRSLRVAVRRPVLGKATSLMAISVPGQVVAVQVAACIYKLLKGEAASVRARVRRFARPCRGLNRGRVVQKHHTRRQDREDPQFDRHENLRAASGMNLTFESRLPLAPFSNVKFENSTRNIYLLVVLKIPTFGTELAAMGTKCWNRTTSVPIPKFARVRC